MCLHSPDPREILRRTSNYQATSAEPLEPEQGQTAGLGLHGNQEISGNTAGVPHLLRAKQLYVSHSPSGRKTGRDKRIRTNTQLRTRKHRQDKPSVTEPVAPAGKAKLLVSGGGARGRLSCYGWQLSGQTVTSQKAPMPLNQQNPRTSKPLFIWDLA